MRLMRDRGVASENIKTSHEGGIDDYSPVQANRNTCVILTFWRQIQRDEEIDSYDFIITSDVNNHSGKTITL